MMDLLAYHVTKHIKSGTSLLVITKDILIDKIEQTDGGANLIKN